MGAQSLLDQIVKHLEDGRTIFVSTYGHVLRITPRNYSSWKASGRDLFRIDSSGHLCVARGKNYDSIMFAKITVGD